MIEAFSTSFSSAKASSSVGDFFFKSLKFDFPHRDILEFKKAKAGEVGRRTGSKRLSASADVGRVAKDPRAVGSAR